MKWITYDQLVYPKRYKLNNTQIKALQKKAENKEWLRVTLKATEKCITHWIEDGIESREAGNPIDMCAFNCDYCELFIMYWSQYGACYFCPLNVIDESCDNNGSLYDNFFNGFSELFDASQMVDALMEIRKTLKEV